MRALRVVDMALVRAPVARMQHMNAGTPAAGRKRALMADDLGGNATPTVDGFVCPMPACTP